MTQYTIFSKKNIEDGMSVLDLLFQNKVNKSTSHDLENRIKGLMLDIKNVKNRFKLMKDYEYHE